MLNPIQKGYRNRDEGGKEEGETGSKTTKGASERTTAHKVDSLFEKYVVGKYGLYGSLFLLTPQEKGENFAVNDGENCPYSLYSFITLRIHSNWSSNYNQRNWKHEKKC